MGIGGISPWSLLLILVIVLLLFGTKKLRGLGGDLGGALKGFKKAMSDDNANASEQEAKKVEADETDEQTPITEEKKDTVETK